MLKCRSLRRWFVVVVIFPLFTGCSDEQAGTQPEIVATVGERVITAREFQLNYEFGFSSLKKAPDRKLSYLDSMIDELILSTEGYRLGLDKTDRVQNLEARLLQELLVEELLRVEVSETITVSDEEIRGAIAGSKVRWKFRYWTETDLGAADRIYKLMQEQGYENVVAERLAREEIRRDPADFETDYMTWLETPPELLEAIKDLQIGELSGPIALDNVYYLIEMIDIRREALAEFDYDQTHDRYKQILYQRKLKAATSHYVTGFMTAKNVVVKGEPFQILVEALEEWKLQNDSSGTFSEAIEVAGDAEPALQKLNRNSGKVLISFAGGRWSMKEFIEKI
ncbi:MAG: peptidyl-prolyl cis-trans isomerase, partial [Bacteroidetes bacterium]